MTRYVSAVFAIGCLLLAARSAVAEADAKAAAADAGTRSAPGEIVAVFPLQSVNVPLGVVRAAEAVLESALLEQGFEVREWEPTLERHTGDARPEPGAVVNHAAPPPPPGARPLARPGFPPVATVQPIPVPVEPPRPVISDARKRELAEELGLDFYVDGSLVKLGSEVRVTVNKRSPAGEVVDTRLMKARTHDDLVTVLERIALGLARDLTVEQTLNLDNATRAETRDLPERFRLETNFGAIIGQAFGVGDAMRYYTAFAFDARLELNDVLVELSPGFAAGEDDSLQLLVNIGVAYYLTHTPVSPYIGVGAGVFFGDRLHDDDEGDGPPAHDDDFDDDDEGNVGFEAFPVIGLEFLRQSSIRVHLDLRYSFSFSPDGDFGHGPVALVGINF